MRQHTAIASVGSRFWTLLWIGLFIVSVGLQYGRLANPSIALAAGPSVVDYSQCSNNKRPSAATDCPGGWINGILNPNNSHYAEDSVTAQRAVLGNLTALSNHSMTFQYQARKGSAGVHAYDSLATWNLTQTTADRCQGLAAADCPSGAASTFAIPDDPQVIAPFTSASGATTDHMIAAGPGRVMTMFGGTITGVSVPVHDCVAASACGTSSVDDYASITVTFTVASDSSVVELLFGGHLAASAGPRGWGAGLGAGSISGGPYHIKWPGIDGSSSGSRDNQIMASALIPPVTPTIATSATATASKGSPISDTATLGPSTLPNTIGGSITFSAFGPSATPTCTGTPAFTSAPVAVSGPGAYGPVSFTPSQAGTYYWIASYSGDSASNLNPVSGACGDNGETSVVLSGSVNLTKTTDTPTVTAGSPIHYTLTVTNPSTNGFVASDVNVTDALPTTASGGGTLSWSIASTSGTPLWTLSGSTLTYHADSLAAEASGSVTITSSTSGVCGTLQNSASGTTGNDGTLAAGPVTITVNCPDVAVVKTASTPTISAGGSASYQVVVTAGGTGSSTHVTLHDTLPSGLAWVVGGPDAAACTVTSGVLTCDFGTLANGATRTITLTATTSAANCPSISNTATVSADVDVDASNDSSGPVTVTVLCGSVNLTKTTDTPTVTAGSPIHYTLTVTNPSTNGFVASDVNVTDALPTTASGGGTLSWSIASTSGTPLWTLSGSTLTYHADSLAAEASGSVTITSSTSGVCGTLQNSASGTTGNDGTLAAGPVTIRVNCPDVAVVKTADASPVSAGDPIGFTVTISNSGNGDASGFTFSDTLPSTSGLTWTIDTGATTGSWSISAGKLVWAGGSTLAAGASFHVHLTSPTTAATCGSVPNTATVSATNEPASADANDTSSASVTVECPSLTLTKTAGASAVSAGQAISFTVTLANAGPGTAKAASVSDPLPAGADLSWSIVSPVTGWSIGGSAGSQTLSFSGDLKASASTSVEVTSETTKADCAQIVNSASADAANNPLGELHAQANTTVQCGALLLTKTAGSGTVNAGDPISYTVTVQNTGSGTLSNVSVNDVLPANPGLAWSIQTPVTGWSIGGGQLTFSASSFASGAQSSVTITSPTTAGTCPLVENSASASGDQTDTVSVGPVDVTVDCPHVTISKTTSSPTVSAGEPIDFTVSATNAGPGAATGLVVSDPLPAGSGVSWSIASPVSGWSLSGPVGSQVLAFSGDLAADASTSVQVTSGTTVASCGTYDNTATASAANNPGSIPSASASVAVECPTIGVSKSVDKATAVPGDVLHYTLTVKNTGQGDASGVTVTDDISPLLAHGTYDGDASNGGTFASPVLTWTGLAIPAGGSISLTFSLTLDQSGFPVGVTTLPNTVVATGLANNCETGSTDPTCSTTTTVTIHPLPSTPTKTLPPTDTSLGVGSGGGDGSPLLPLVLVLLIGLAVSVRFLVPAPARVRVRDDRSTSRRSGRPAPSDPFRFRRH